jgi:hypothetical protein
MKCLLSLYNITRGCRRSSGVVFGRVVRLVEAVESCRGLVGWADSHWLDYCQHLPGRSGVVSTIITEYHD